MFGGGFCSVAQPKETITCLFRKYDDEDALQENQIIKRQDDEFDECPRCDLSNKNVVFCIFLQGALCFLKVEILFCIFWGWFGGGSKLRTIFIIHSDLPRHKRVPELATEPTNMVWIGLIWFLRVRVDFQLNLRFAVQNSNLGC